MKLSFIRHNVVPHILAALLLLWTGCSGTYLQRRHLHRAEVLFAQQRYDEAFVEYLNVLKYKPVPPAAARNLGISAFETSDYAMAFQWLGVAAARDAGDPEVMTRLAVLYLHRGDRAKAHALADDILLENPRNLEAGLVWSSTSADALQIEAGLTLLETIRAERPGESRLPMAIGFLHMRRGSMEDALTAFDDAIRCAPGDADPYIARGDVRMLLRQPDQAGEDFRRARSIAPGPSVAGIRWALYLRSTGNDAAALTELDDMINHDPDFVPAFYERAVIRAGRAQWTFALEDADRVLTLQPGHLPASLLRIQALKKSGQHEESLDALAEAERMFPRSLPLKLACARRDLESGQVLSAMEQLRQIMRVDPGYVDASMLLAQLEIQQGLYDDALVRLPGVLVDQSAVRPAALLLLGHAQRLRGHYHAALTSYEALSLVKTNDAHPWYMMGLTHQAAGRKEAAARSYARALEKNALYVPALTSMMALHLADGRPDLAGQQIDERLQFHPDSTDLLYLRASLAIRSGKLELAERDLVHVLQVDSSNAPAYRDLSRIFIAQGRTDEALARLANSIERHPDDITARMMQAVIWQGMNQHDRAMNGYEEILRIDPGITGALNNLAYLLVMRKSGDDLERAFALARRAREQAPGDPSVADTLAMVAMQRREFPWAISLLQESLAQLPDNPQILWHYAGALTGAGREEEALIMLEKALAGESDFHGRDEAMALRQLLAISLDQPGRLPAHELEALFDRWPDHPSAMARRGMWHEQAGRRDEAIVWHRAALAEWPDYLPSLIAMIRLSGDDMKQALASGRHARKLAPQNPDVAFELGRAALRHLDYSWAFSLLGEADANDPDRAELGYWYALSALLMGHVDVAKSKLSVSQDKSCELLEHLLAAYLDPSLSLITPVPANHPELIPLMRLIEASRSDDEAIAANYQRLIDDYPAWMLPVRDYAARLIAMDQVSREEIMMARRARDGMPRDPVARRTYALALARAGDRDEARYYLEECLSITPDDEVLMFWLSSIQESATTEP